MSEELLIPCAACAADVGVILGAGTREELAGLRCWRCKAGLPPAPPPAPAPPLVPHHCPPTSLNIYRTGWKCNACGRLLSGADIAAQLEREAELKRAS